jgi:DNA-binding winged helix-turn-helix (wHTH) protein
MGTEKDSALSDLAKPRCWQFGLSTFDEGAWTLHVEGQRVALENKPLQLLRVLLQRPGQLVSKSELLDAVWPDVVVVEASLPTAMNKLRRAIGDTDSRIIETVAGSGYRLSVPVTWRAADTPTGKKVPNESTAAVATGSGYARRWRFAGMAIAGLAGSAVVMAMVIPRAEPSAARPITDREVMTALRNVDLPAIRTLLDRGWNPNAPLYDQRNNAIDRILEVCQWDPGHDKRRLMLAVKMLMDGGAEITNRNVWGDTAFSIASSPRYCGKTHPATLAMRASCMQNDMRLRTACLADYAHSDWPQLPAHPGDAPMSVVPKATPGA